jgi:hypothetical protein
LQGLRSLKGSIGGLGKILMDLESRVADLEKFVQVFAVLKDLGDRISVLEKKSGQEILEPPHKEGA